MRLTGQFPLSISSIENQKTLMGFGGCLGVVWGVFGECLEVVWEVFGGGLGVLTTPKHPPNHPQTACFYFDSGWVGSSPFRVVVGLGRAFVGSGCGQ